MKFSIKQQLVFLIAVLFVAMLIVSGICMKELSRSAKALESVYKDSVATMVRLNKMGGAYFVGIASTARKANGGKIGWDQAIAAVVQKEKVAKTQLDRMAQTSNNAKLVADMVPIFQQIGQIGERLKVILRAHSRDGLRQFIDETMDPGIERLQPKFSGLFDAEQERAKSVLQQLGYHITAANRILLVIIFAVLCASLLIAYLMLRNIKRSFSKIVAQTRKFAQGDLSIRIQEEADKELGQLTRAFNQMADSLQELVSKVQRSGIQVASSATEIAASIKEQQATSTEQAATTTEISASTKEIAGTARTLAGNMEEVVQVADTAATLAESGREDLARMETTMNRMMEATQGIAARLAVLNEKSTNINSVVTTINKVADQTNLLSLNAAIEAEKAGEHGLGFGVVATEIRRLSDQTAVATWDIEQLVKEMQSAVSSGVMGMEKFSEEVRYGVEQVKTVNDRLMNIVSSVQMLTPHFDSVSKAMQEQSKGSDQINQALEQLTQTVHGSAEAMRESARVVDQLNEASHNLQAAVSGFKESA